MGKDFIIILAWPEGMVAAAGGWYDVLFAQKGKYGAMYLTLLEDDGQPNYDMLTH